MAVRLPKRRLQWLQLPGGVEVLCGQVTRLHYDMAIEHALNAARSIATAVDLRIELGVEDDDLPKIIVPEALALTEAVNDLAALDQTEHAYEAEAAHAARLGLHLLACALFKSVKDWRGIEDDYGQPLELTRRNWARLMLASINGVWVAPVFLSRAAQTCQLEIDEGNVFAAGPDGHSDPAAMPAPPAAPAETPAPQAG